MPLTQPAHATFDGQMANSRQHSELVGDDQMPVTRGYTVAKYPTLHSPGASVFDGRVLVSPQVLSCLPSAARTGPRPRRGAVPP